MKLKEETKCIEIKETIKVTRDKIENTLHKYQSLKIPFDRFMTLSGLSITILFVICTANFHDVLNIAASVFEAIAWICFSLFSLGAIIYGIKALYNKITGKADDEWFWLTLQGKKKPKKEKREVVWDSGSVLYIIGNLLHLILYILPLVLWIIVLSLVDWNVAWGKTLNNSNMPYWLITIILSIIWFAFTYLYLFIYWVEINDFFEEKFG